MSVDEGDRRVGRAATSARPVRPARRTPGCARSASVRRHDVKAALPRIEAVQMLHHHLGIVVERRDAGYCSWTESGAGKARALLRNRCLRAALAASRNVLPDPSRSQPGRRPVQHLIEAREGAVFWLRQFRQAEKYARDPGTAPTRPGRSRWPEPDKLRRIFRTHSAAHRPRYHDTLIWPRAQFGLPIVG